MFIEQRLLGLITKFFNDMPPAVRVITYFVILFLLVYGAVQPHTVTGRIIIKDPNGREVHYRAQEILADFGDTPIKFRTNEDGIFVVPAPRLGSLNIRVDLTPLDPAGEEDWRPVAIGPANYLVQDVVTLVYSKKDRQLKIAASGLGAITVGVAEGLFGRTAHAGSIQPKSRAPGATVPTWANPKKPSLVKDVDSKITKIVGQATNRNPSTIRDNFPLARGARKISLFDLLVIVEDVEQEFKIRIPDEHWQALKNVGELKSYVVNRINISDHYKIDRSVDWRKIQRKIPELERPSFKRY